MTAGTTTITASSSGETLAACCHVFFYFSHVLSALPQSLPYIMGGPAALTTSISVSNERNQNTVDCTPVILFPFFLPVSAFLSRAPLGGAPLRRPALSTPPRLGCTRRCRTQTRSGTGFANSRWISRAAMRCTPMVCRRRTPAPVAPTSSPRAPMRLRHWAFSLSKTHRTSLPAGYGFGGREINDVERCSGHRSGGDALGTAAHRPAVVALTFIPTSF